VVLKLCREQLSRDEPEIFILDKLNPSVNNDIIALIIQTHFGYIISSIEARI